MKTPKILISLLLLLSLIFPLGLGLYSSAQGNEVTSVTFNSVAINLTKGSTFSIIYNVYPANVQSNLTWSSSDPSVATVVNGMVYGAKRGVCVITATSENNISAVCVVLVNDSSNIETRTNLAINKVGLNLQKNQTVSLSSSAYPIATMGEVITWKSSNPSVAAVNSNGKVTALNDGICIITATNSKNKSVKCAVWVYTPSVKPVEVESISLGVLTADVYEGSTYTFEPVITPSNAENKTLTWTSSNTSVATVLDGVVTAKAQGTAKITATSANGKTASCTIRVLKPPVAINPTSIKFDETKMEISVGAKRTFKPIILPSNATNTIVTYTSSNTSVASVDANGTVTGLKTGTAVITAKTVNNLSASYNVTVNNMTDGTHFYSGTDNFENNSTVKFSGSSTDGWITVSDGKFMLNGTEWTSIGATNYSHSSASYTFIDNAMLEMRQSGLNLIRVCDMLDSVYGSTDRNSWKNENIWVQTDYIIKKAKDYGLKVLIDLATFREYFFRQKVDSYATSTYETWTEIASFISNRTNTFTNVKYKDDPTIFSYAILGEPVPYTSEYGTDVFSTTDVNASRKPSVICAAILHIAKQFKEQSPKALIQTGGLLHFPTNSNLRVSGQYYWIYLWRSEYIDYATIHIYPNQTSIFNSDGSINIANSGEWKNLSSRKTEAANYGLPLMVEEFGYDRSASGATYQRCIDYYSFAFSSMNAAGIKHAVFWNWGYGKAFDTGTHMPEVINVIKQYSQSWSTYQQATSTINSFFPISDDKIKKTLLLQGFESSSSINGISVSSFVKGKSRVSGNVTQGEYAAKLDINITQSYLTTWHTFSTDGTKSVNGYNYLAMDVFVPAGYDSMSISLGIDANGWKRYSQSGASMRTNMLVPGRWKTIYVPLVDTPANAFMGTWSGTNKSLTTGNVDRLDITIFAQTAYGEGYILIDNIRLIAV